MMLLLLLGEGWCGQCHYDGGCDNVFHLKISLARSQGGNADEGVWL